MITRVRIISYHQFCLLLLLMMAALNARATHIVGGSVTYKCLGQVGSNVQYQIQVEIYQDCLTGLDVARREDNPAFIGIFPNSGGGGIIDSIGYRSGGDTVATIVPPNFKNECVNNPPAVCLRKLTFTKNYTLPANASGYTVIYSRCCRNETILNLNRPELVGATYFCKIPPVSEGNCNTSAFFKNYPPQIICINNPLVYDHSATDVDGDSLSYELCESYPGGTTSQPKPYPSGFLPPPISQPNGNPPSYGYALGFTAAKPMAGNPLIQINPVTGVISGTPRFQGRYVVSVCAHEWRNGTIINTVRREFQFVVTNCSKAVVADIPTVPNEINTFIVECKTKTVQFVNTSRGGFKYNWDFGVPGGTSTDFEPKFTYPDTGTYVVTLKVNEGSTCPDSISRFVKVYPEYSADYSFAGLQCPNAEISFADLSQATYKPIVRWQWDFADGTTSSQQNPTHRFSTGGEYNVRLVSTSIKGCTDTMYKTVNIERFRPFAGNDTIIVKGEVVDFNAQGGIDYTWTPMDKLNATNINNPRGTYPDTGRFAYNVHIKSSYGCEGDDSIEVWVVNQASLFVPNAFTPNGDGYNDVFRPVSVGYRDYKYFRIFNRWGELVFKTDVIGPGWDGTYKGRPADIGAYYWLLNAEFKDGTYKTIKGDVTLIR